MWKSLSSLRCELWVINHLVLRVTQGLFFVIRNKTFQSLTLPLTLMLWKPLEIIKEATSTVNTVMGILWAASPGNRLDGHSNVTATVQLSHNSLGCVPTLAAQFWISLLWQVHSFLPPSSECSQHQKVLRPSPSPHTHTHTNPLHHH